MTQKVLGRGGFGIVYEGLLEGRVVAVKRQKLEENTKKQIQREIEENRRAWAICKDALLEYLLPWRATATSIGLISTSEKAGP